MTDYFTKFDTQDQYYNFSTSYCPTVSYCVENDKVFFKETPKTYITYTASSKLYETTNINTSGLHINKFDSEIVSHYFSYGIGTIQFSGIIKNLYEFAFYGCQGLTSITLPNTVTDIQNSAFSGCTSLINIKLSEDLVDIGHSVFQNCTSLKSIYIPKNVFNIGLQVFNNCYNLESIEVNSRNPYYFSENNCIYQINSSYPLMYGCKNSIIKETSTSIIGDYAFAGQINLTSIVIPSNITSIRDYAFAGCTGLKIIGLLSSTPNILLGTGVFNNLPSDFKIYVPYGTSNAWKNAQGWNYYADKIFEYDAGTDELE